MRKILVNTADDKSLCDFYFPAVTEKDGVVIGMNSGGKSPKTVRKVREYLEGYRESYEYKNEWWILNRSVRHFSFAEES